MDSRLEELKRAVQSAAEGLSSEQLTWHPPGKWCAAEILEHLYLTYTGTIKGFAKVLEAGKPLATRASVMHRMRTIVVVRFLHMPEGRKAPVNTRPKGLPGVNVRSEVGTKIMEMDAIIAQCEARFGPSRRLLDHPILGPLTASEWRTFHFVHGRHHVKQILRLRESVKLIE
jgi:Protein of unknown function (DUF1569)